MNELRANELRHEWLEEARLDIPGTTVTVTVKTEAWWGKLDSIATSLFLRVGIATVRLQTENKSGHIKVPYLPSYILSGGDDKERHYTEFGIKRTNWLRRVAQLHDETVERMNDPYTEELVKKALGVAA